MYKNGGKLDMSERAEIKCTFRELKSKNKKIKGGT